MISIIDTMKLFKKFPKKAKKSPNLELNSKLGGVF